MTGSRIAERRQILGRDDSVPLSNTIVQDIASAINTALFHQKAPAHFSIMNAKKDGKDAITAIMHPKATAHMGLQSHNKIIAVARTVNRGVVDFEAIE